MLVNLQERALASQQERLLAARARGYSRLFGWDRIRERTCLRGFAFRQRGEEVTGSFAPSSRAVWLRSIACPSVGEHSLVTLLIRCTAGETYRGWNTLPEEEFKQPRKGSRAEA
ncbi:hypothetical protein V5799_029129, partial [Amblyomma americanum]